MEHNLNYLDQIKNRQYTLKKIDTPHPSQKSSEQLNKLEGNKQNPGEYLSDILQIIAERRIDMKPESDDEEEDYESYTSDWDF